MAIHDVESSAHAQINNAYVIENGVHVKLNHAYVVENSVLVKLWSSEIFYAFKGISASIEYSTVLENGQAYNTSTGAFMIKDEDWKNTSSSLGISYNTPMSENGERAIVTSASSVSPKVYKWNGSTFALEFTGSFEDIKSLYSATYVYFKGVALNTNGTKFILCVHAITKVSTSSYTHQVDLFLCSIKNGAISVDKNLGTVYSKSGCSSTSSGFTVTANPNLSLVEINGWTYDDGTYYYVRMVYKVNSNGTCTTLLSKSMSSNLGAGHFSPDGKYYFCPISSSAIQVYYISNNSLTLIGTTSYGGTFTYSYKANLLSFFNYRNTAGYQQVHQYLISPSGITYLGVFSMGQYYTMTDITKDGAYCLRGYNYNNGATIAEMKNSRNNNGLITSMTQFASIVSAAGGVDYAVYLGGA